MALWEKKVTKTAAGQVTRTRSKNGIKTTTTVKIGNIVKTTTGSKTKTRYK